MRNEKRMILHLAEEFSWLRKHQVSNQNDYNRIFENEEAMLAKRLRKTWNR